MSMREWLRDVFRHQEWADAEHWRAINGSDRAGDDDVLRKRLHHIHFVQHAFLWTVGDRQTPFAMTTPGDFASAGALRDYARGFHAGVEPFFDGLNDARLVAPVDIVWFQDPPLTIPVLEALTQCAMHSQHHRGQNAARLRELGAEPPTTDYIVWLWKGRPAPAW